MSVASIKTDKVSAIKEKMQSHAYARKLAIKIISQTVKLCIMNKKYKLMQKNTNFIKQMQLAGSLFKKRRFNEAIFAFEKALAIEQTWDAYQGMGCALLEANQPLLATKALQKSIKLKEHWSTYQSIGWALFRTNQRGEAIKSFTKAIEIRENWSCYQGIGFIYFDSKDYKTALTALNKSIKLKENWVTRLKLGWIYHNLKQYQNAIQEFHESLKYEYHWSSHYGLGLSLFQIHQFQLAIVEFKKSLALKENACTYQGLGSALFQTNQYKEAIEALKASLIINPTWNTYQNLGWALLKSDQFEESIIEFDKSISMTKHWSTYQGLGHALYKMNKIKESIENLKISISMKEHWHTYQDLGLALLENNQFKEAKIALDKSLALEEKEDAYRGLSKALLKDNHFQEALITSQRWYALEPSNDALKDFYNVLHYYTENEGNKSIEEFLKTIMSKEPEKASRKILKYIKNKQKTSYINPIILRQILQVQECALKKSNHGSQAEALQRIKNIQTRDVQRKGYFGHKKKFVFGVSHSRKYLTCHNFQVLHVGAGTMYGIGNTNSRTQHCNKILSKLSELEANSTCLIFEFGEVDLRNHITKQSIKKSESPYAICDSAIAKYLDFLELVQSQGFEIIICGPHCGGGTASGFSSNIERNDLCAYLNNELAMKGNSRGIYFYTLFDIAVNQKSLKEVDQLFSDKFHLHVPPNEIGEKLATLSSIRANNASKNFFRDNKEFYLETISANLNILASDIPNWYPGLEIPAGEHNLIHEDWDPNTRCRALIALPFGMAIKEITLTFQNAGNDLETSVEAIQEEYDLSKECERNNLINSKCTLVREQKIVLIKHRFQKLIRTCEISRYFILTIKSKCVSTSLRSIDVARYIHESLKPSTGVSPSINQSK